MPKREELDESECILYVDTNEEQTAADLHFADPKSGFQTAVPLLQPEEPPEEPDMNNDLDMSLD